MQRGTDLTRAVLQTLAQAYPKTIGLQRLEQSVSCEGGALDRHLRILEQVGAISTSPRSDDVSERGVRMTDVAMKVFTHDPSSLLRGPGSPATARPGPNLM